MRRGQSNPMKGKPRPPLWDDAELAMLDAILWRSPDGLETARKREIVDVAAATGRTVSAVATMLCKRRMANVSRSAARAAGTWSAGE